jgi:hypothetical protein
MVGGREPGVTTRWRSKQRRDAAASRAVNFLVLAIPAAKRLHFFPNEKVFLNF